MKEMYRAKWIVSIGIMSLIGFGCSEEVQKAALVEAGYVRSNQKRDLSYSPTEGGFSPSNPSFSLVKSQANVALNAPSTFQKNGLASSGLFGGGEAQEAISGYFVGLRTEVGINDKLSALGGLRFITKGSETEFNASSSARTRLNYIDIPLLVQYSIKPKFYVQGGLQPSILISAKRTSIFEGRTTTTDAGDLYGGFDLGASFGLGYSFTNNLGLELSYDFGFLNSLENSDFGSTTNQALRLGAIYKIKSW